MWTVWPTSMRAKPFGVPWSNRTSTGRFFGTQTLSHEFEDGLHLFSGHVELLDDLVDAEVREILDDRGDGQAGAPEHPRATDPIGDALDRRTLGPVKCSRGPTLLHSSLREVGPVVTRVDALELAFNNLAHLVRTLGWHRAVKVDKRSWSDRPGHHERNAPVFTDAGRHAEGLNTPSSYTASSVSFSVTPRLSTAPTGSLLVAASCLQPYEVACYNVG